jgi:hypothetical protein
MAIENKSFFWGEGDEVLTEDQIKQRRRVAEALAAKGGDYSPVGHWTQGLARVANAAAGAIQNRRLDEAEKANREYDQSIAADMITAFEGGAGSAAASSPDAAAPSFASGDGSTRAMTMPLTGDQSERAKTVFGASAMPMWPNVGRQDAIDRKAGNWHREGRSASEEVWAEVV